MNIGQSLYTDLMNNTYPIKFTAQLRQHLRALRKKRGLTQAQLGLLVGVSQARIAEIEANPGLVSFDQMMQLLAALEVTVSLNEAPTLPAPLAQKSIGTTTYSQVERLSKLTTADSAVEQMRTFNEEGSANEQMRKTTESLSDFSKLHDLSAHEKKGSW
jgi:transcriptional regulator with XRE-family HTH domain